MAPPRSACGAPPQGGATSRPAKPDLRRLLGIFALLPWLLCAPAAAQNVSLQGMLGSSKAVLMIDGAAHTLAVGATVKGVTLQSLSGGQAQVLAGGRAMTLTLGGSQASVGGGAATAGGNSIVIPVGSGGHFFAQGAINGKPVRFMVDTGATMVAMGRGDAERIGVDWKTGQRGATQTAGGTVPAYRVNLTRVRVGEVEVYNVDALVVGADMPDILLGNSFLSRFSMRRDGDTMRLERR